MNLFRRKKEIEVHVYHHNVEKVFTKEKPTKLEVTSQNHLSVIGEVSNNRKCVWCKKPFASYHGTKTCSESCKIKHRKRMKHKFYLKNKSKWENEYRVKREKPQGAGRGYFSGNRQSKRGYKGTKYSANTIKLVKYYSKTHTAPQISRIVGVPTSSVYYLRNVVLPE